MSHATVLVIGDDIDGQMAPYDENATVEPYKNRLGRDPGDWPCSWVAKNAPEVDLLDAPAVAAWLNAEFDDAPVYGADDEGLYETTTYNPKSKWDWYQIGGRWSGLLIPSPAPRRERGAATAVSWARPRGGTASTRRARAT